MWKLSLGTCLVLGSWGSCLAENAEPRYEGCYEVKNGQVETLATSLFSQDYNYNPNLRQQGIVSVRLKHVDRHPGPGIRKRIRIKAGSIVGEGAADGSNFRHTLVDDDRKGMMISDSGLVIAFAPSQEDPACVRNITERLSGFTGFGKYQDVDFASEIFVSGEINICNGINTFDEVQGQLCFR